MKPSTIAVALAWVGTILAAVAALAGLVAPGVYRDAAFWVQQARGIDLATLGLGVPILALGLWAAGRGSPLGRLVVVGGLLYLVYNYGIYTTSVAMNPLTAVYIAILGLAIWSLGLMLLAPDLPTAGRWPVRRLPRRTTAGFLLVVAGLFSLLWLGQIASFLMTGALPADLERAGLPANPVYALDLAVFLPLAAVAAIGLLRGWRVASAFVMPMLVWVVLTSAGILGGFLFAALAGDVVSVPVAGVIVLVGIIAVALAAIPFLRRPDASQPA